MALPTWFANTMTRLENRQSRRARRRPAALRRTPAEPSLEKLEDRLLLSGFGPEDGAYIVEPWLGVYQDVKIQPGDQKIVATGSKTDGTGLPVARYDSMGNADMTYGSAGLANPLGTNSGYALGLVLQPDGKAVVTGNVSNNNAILVARLNANGSPDSGFGSGGWSSFDVQPGWDAARGVGLQSSGKIVVSGNVGSLPYSAFVARFKANGAIDSGKGGFGKVVQGKATGATVSTFGSDSNSFSALAIQSDDKLVAAGCSYNPVSDTSKVLVARYTASGALDTTFNGSGYSAFSPPEFTSAGVWAIALQSDGKIVTAGQAGADMMVTRYNANGTLDTGFGGGSGYVLLDIDGAATSTAESGRDLVIQPDGKIVVAGYVFTHGVGPHNVLVARLNTNGSLDASFGTGGFKIGASPAGHDFHGYAVSLQSNGNIIVAGQDYEGGTVGTVKPLLMRFSGSSASPLQAASTAPVSATLARAPSAPLVSVATAESRLAAPSATVVLPPLASGVAVVGTSRPTKRLATGQPNLAMGTTVSPPILDVTSAVDRIFAEDDLLSSLLATDLLGFMNFK